MELRPGLSLLHYRLVEKIGEGGMGEVYLAEDTKLGRRVALKSLPAAMAADSDRLDRFRREARALAVLHHPNIVTVHAAEEADGIHFLTMNLVEGRRLDEGIPLGGVDLDRLFEISIPLADAVAYAHERGIVHRDLKPANVMLTEDGRVQVLDFGLAKFAEATTATAEATVTRVTTREGLVMGTVPYMSPEQLQGKTVDPRSDVFSMGVLLYQMATGRLPFGGDNTASVISAILRDAAEPVTVSRSDLPNHLGRVIQRCLEKDPERRFQTAKDLRIELEGLRREVVSGAVSGGLTPATRPAPGRSWTWWAAAVLVVAIGTSWWALRDREPRRDGAAESATAAPSKIAVLPFENLGDPDDDYFAAGMTEELTSRLAAIPGLAVISRKSAQQYAGSAKSIPEIGAELDTAWIVAGTVRWARSAGPGGSRVRITPQLIDVAADTQTWSAVYDRELDDVFRIQTDIARDIVTQLGVTLGGPDAASLGEAPTENVEAYQAYLRGNYLSDVVLGADRLREAIQDYERAVELDPGFTAAWARLCMTHALVYHLGYDVSDARHEAARRALEELERVAPGSGEAHLARGYYLYHGFKDYDSAVEQLRRARDLLPHDTKVLGGLAYILRRQGRFDEAIAILEKTVELDPRNPMLRYDLGETLIYARRYANAIATLDISLALQPAPNSSNPLKILAIWVSKGPAGLAEARAATDVALASEPEEYAYFMAFWQAIYEGRPDEALEVLSATGWEWNRTPEWTAPTALYEAIAYDRAGREREARAFYETAVRMLEAETKRSPEDFRLPGSLAQAYAGLGRHEAAIAAAERGLAMMPPDRDALNGPARVWELAAVHAQVGDPGVAVDLLKDLFAFTGGFTRALVELDPRMERVRKHPRYGELHGPGPDREAR